MTRNAKKWDSMGLCTRCGGMRTAPYKMCERCREKDREQRRKAVIELFHPPAAPIESKVKSDHKCWNCEWGKFLDDRFFCPFAEGTCMKEGNIIGSK